MRRALLLMSLAACTATPAPPPSTPAPSVVRPSLPPVGQEITVYDAPALHGDYALVLASENAPTAIARRAEIWAVPLAAGGSAIRLVGWRTVFVDAVNVPRGWALLSRQLSPDGRRIGISYHPGPVDSHAPERVAIVDLSARSARELTPAGDRHYVRPAWSPDGRRIAFDRTGGVGFWGGIAVIDVDGTNLRDVCGTTVGAVLGRSAFQGCYAMDAWTADGRGIRVYEVGGYKVVDADTGRVTEFGLAGTSLTSASWRATEPALVIAAQDVGEQRIVVARSDGSEQRTIVREPSSSGVRFRDARWNPRDSRVLYRSAVVTGSGGTQAGGEERAELVIVDASGTPRAVGACAARGEWHPNATDLVLIDGCTRNAISIVTLGAEPGKDIVRSVHVPVGDAMRLVDLATVRYP